METRQTREAKIIFIVLGCDCGCYGGSCNRQGQTGKEYLLTLDILSEPSGCFERFDIGGYI